MAKIYIFILCILAPFLGFPQKYLSAVENYKYFSQKNSFQKIYIQTDRFLYSANDILYFKTYLINAKNYCLDSTNQILYAELINPEKKIVFQKYLMSKNGVASTYFILPDSLKYGNYQLRIYSNPMSNFSSEFFSTKEVFIDTKNKEYSYNFFYNYKAQLKQNKKYLYYQINNDNLYLNTNNTIFYAFSTSLFFKNIKIIITDKNNEVIATKNKLIDTINFIPKENKKYFLLVKGDKKTLYKIKLPTPIRNDFETLFLEDSNICSFKISTVRQNIKLNFIAENNGNLILSKIISSNKNYIEFSINKDTLPYGFVHFVIFDNSNIIFSKFIFNNLNLKTFDKINSIIKNDTLYLNFKPENNEKLNVSVSLTNDTTINNSTIKKELFLNSEIPYFAKYYFNKNCSEIITNNVFSYLHTNQKYDLDRILSTKDSLAYQPQKGISIKGTVNVLFEKVKAKNTDLVLKILSSYNDTYATKTNDSGQFIFEDLVYFDTISFSIESTTKINKKINIITIDEYDTNQIFFDAYKGINVKKLKMGKNYETNSSHANNIIYAKDIKNSGNQNVFQILSGKVPGVEIQGNSAIIRGKNSFLLSSEALYMIDNVVVDADAIASVNIDDIERIEIYKTTTSAYGQNSGNGIIAVFTKQGYNIAWGHISAKIFGIATDKHFEYKNQTEPQTYYWNPNFQTNQNTTIKIPLNKFKSKIFLLSVQGITINGKIIDYNKRFTLN